MSVSSNARSRSLSVERGLSNIIHNFRELFACIEYTLNNIYFNLAQSDYNRNGVGGFSNANSQNCALLMDCSIENVIGFHVVNVRRLFDNLLYSVFRVFCDPMCLIFV